MLPDVYAPTRRPLTLADRAVAAWLWTHRDGVVSGLAASALHGAKWVDDDVAVEMIHSNCKPPDGVITREDKLSDGETVQVAGMRVTTPARTAFDLARRGSVGAAVARLDALARATAVKTPDVLEVASRHPHVRGLSRLDQVLDLVDAGAQSPRESWLRLLFIEQGFPRPQTQIPVLSPSGFPLYYLDMGWPEVMIAVEYDGDQHRADRQQFVKDIARLDYVQSLGWIAVRVVTENRRADIMRRVRAAWQLRQS